MKNALNEMSSNNSADPPPSATDTTPNRSNRTVSSTVNMGSAIGVHNDPMMMNLFHHQLGGFVP
jgi:hypothetical protein